MLHIAICDDNISELSNMVQLINLYQVSKNIPLEYSVFSNGFDLISTLEKGKQFNIYCLDIIMPGFMGIEVAREIRQFDKTAPILFFTSSREFALDSYSVKAINYVLKPITKEKLFISFDDMLEQLDSIKEDAIVVKSQDGLQKIVIHNLTYVEVIGRNVQYHLNSGKVVRCTESFTSVCQSLLSYHYFMKPHRSYLINMNYIGTIDNSQIKLQTNDVIPVAQGKTREVKQQYLDYQMEVE